jgi:hypothetical protein
MGDWDVTAERKTHFAAMGHKIGWCGRSGRLTGLLDNVDCLACLTHQNPAPRYLMERKSRARALLPSPVQQWQCTAGFPSGGVMVFGAAGTTAPAAYGKARELLERTPVESLMVEPVGGGADGASPEGGWEL